MYTDTIVITALVILCAALLLGFFIIEGLPIIG